MLPDAVRKRIAAEAERRGQDPEAALAAAEKSAPTKRDDDKPDDSGDSRGSPSKPLADRLLIGFLPFIKVRELREHWLGLPERIADDEMMCGDFALKHGGSGSGAVAEPE